MASADEIRRLLDDPHVSAQTKKLLLRDLAAMAESNDDELRRYARELGASEDEIIDLHDGADLVGGIDLDPEDEHIGRAERDRELGQSWANLTDSTSSPTSDAILDDGVVGLKIFDEFHPRFTRAGGSGQNVDPDSLRRAVDELRGIDFRAFATDASAVGEVVSGVDDSRNHLAQAWSTSLSGWTGPAAESANQYKAKFDGAVATLDAGIKPIPGALTSASQTIQKQVTDYAKLLHNQWDDGRMAGMTPREVDAALDGRDELPGVIAELEAKIYELNHRSLLDRAFDFAVGALGFLVAGPIGAIAAITAVHFASEITEDNIEEETEKYRQALRGCAEKIGQFIDDYSARAASVHEYTEQTCQAVQDTYDALFAVTTGQGQLSANPFDTVGATPDFEDAQPSGNGHGPGGGGPGGGGPGGGGPGAGGGVPINTGGGGGGGYSPPALPTDSTDPALAGGGPGGGGGTDPSQAGGGRVPGGLGDPTDPRGGQGANPPSIPVGGGGGGGNGAVPGQPGAPKEVTIKDGNRAITVGEPDARGRSKLTIDDGTGNPKSYELDFGTGEGGEDGDVIRPGADGKAVIRDGDTTITTEQVPGQPGQLKMTVDDGTPPPNTYTLDFDTPTPGGLDLPSSTAGAAGLGGGGGIGGGGGGIGGGGIGGGGGGIGGGGGGAATPNPAALDFGGATGAQAPGAVDERLATPAGASAGAGPGGGPTGGPVGGMPMGAMGAGAGQGGDQARTSKWRTQGQLFDDDDPAATFDGIVGEDPANRPPAKPTKRT
ncbi:MAG TPA: hypothetical protein VFV67_16005 [Actinophytocola sp.]|uniref:hypothetical protein n=1 Tax=Actinophytocola sp. TaxID=1872138 RepID=UPI002DB9E635|nr:hypothetical protein [Actinophytocola sp.]HEU5472157.1 hypothetical protein [Actinophytocola sp.]